MQKNDAERRQYHREYYHRNKSWRRAREAKARLERYAFVNEYKTTHPCIDCGETDPIVLDFDHRDPEDKIKAVGDMVRARRPVHLIHTEMAKCDIRCSNCHRRKTAKTRQK
jgi:hypothetical protein